MDSKLKKLGYVLSTVTVFVGVQVLVSGCITYGAFEVIEEGATARQLVYDTEDYRNENEARGDAETGTPGDSAYWETFEWDPEKEAWVEVGNPSHCEPQPCHFYDEDDDDDDDDHHHGG